MYGKIGNNMIAKSLNEWVFGVHNGNIVSATNQSIPGVVKGTVVQLQHASSFQSTAKPKVETYVFFPK